MNDMELTEALKGLYTEEVKSTPERVEENVPGYEPKLCRERFEIGYGNMQVSVDYSNRCIAVQNGAEVLRMPFYAIPKLMHFLGWLVDSRDVGKE